MAGVELFGDIGLFTGNLAATIDERLHEHAPELGELLVELVREKTPERRGALREDMTFEAYPDPGDSDLVFVYASGSQEMAVWRRIYVQYQEGEPLGQHTYTNAPRQMFLQTAEGDGVGVTEDWALTYVNEAIDYWLGGAGAP